ncbi:hypothetical protein TSUD_130190 [Trifolium subterraneum]|nr:hypothetical protein TSUD_130190 [Trifolium subterraneum]
MTMVQVKCLRKCEENKIVVDVVVYVGVVKREENDDGLMLEIKEGVDGVVVDIGVGFD